MSCYHPKIIIITEEAKLNKNGKIGSLVKFVEDEKAWGGYENIEKFNAKAEEQRKKYGLKKTYATMAPCGKCQGCRFKQSKEWAVRIEKEAKQYKHNYFVTLTYNDENLPIKEGYPESKGTLKKEHTIQFMKSIRQSIKRHYNHDGIKFYLCGEYGSKGERPHYHIIMMNMPELEKNKLVGQNTKTKDPYFTNDLFDSAWSKGFVIIGKVNWNTISYVAGYCQKKLFGEVGKKIYEMKGQEPIYATMSRNPGIGRNYYEENKETIYRYDEVITSKGKSVKPPSYFDRLMDIGEEDSIILKELKEKRREKSNNALKQKYAQTTLTIKEQLALEERTAVEKLKKYNRDRIGQ
ncbi:replication initiator protein [Capybara microvirus Cap3_SP_433]|nr:replication initiator protein [Capybara microvirus Cap3_SP_433]